MPGIGNAHQFWVLGDIFKTLRRRADAVKVGAETHTVSVPSDSAHVGLNSSYALFLAGNLRDVLYVVGDGLDSSFARISDEVWGEVDLSCCETWHSEEIDCNVP